MSSPAIVFVVPPHVHLLDLTGPVQVFYEAGTYGAPYRMHYCSYQHALTSSAGLGFANVLPFMEVETQPGDYIFLPGLEMDYLRSPALKKEAHPFFEWLRK